MEAYALWPVSYSRGQNPRPQFLQVRFSCYPGLTVPSGNCKTPLYKNRSTPEAEPIVRPPSTYCYPLYLKHLPKNVSAYGQRRLLELLARGGRRGRAHDVGARTGTVLMMRASCVTPRDGTPAGRWDRGSVSGRGTYCYPKGIKLASEGLDLLLYKWVLQSVPDGSRSVDR